MDNNLRSRIPRPQIETYSTAHGKSWIWNALPGPVTSLYGLIASGSITGLAYYFGDSFGGGQGYFWSVVAIGTMTFIGMIVFLVSARRAKRAAAASAGGFESAVKGSAAGWETAGSDVQEIARLDDLRAKFQQGIEIFNQHGKSLYELPWYVIVGEPSSGKSEAIRRSELRFPQGLQDKFQGVGGTHSMNWWFTNHAVILDTAGAILMDPEAAQRFEEFLNLLRIHRTDYPINGMILTLPVDKLMTDPPHVAEEKARTIAAQLAIVQKALDVRFPLYVMISKSDRLPGFREFVDAEGQTPFEPQIFGWSNPSPLDEPFDVKRLDEALECISSRLHRRILTLIADPIARQEGHRRMDEVDSIYSLPEMLRTLTPRLQCYLAVLFQTGTWASKPPFFRGLYFTSALREGNELDQALAKAMNMDVHKLPTGGLFAQEKAVFLRDLFLTKIFQEKGLVTRLKNVGALLRRRLVTFFAISFGLVVLLLLGALIIKSKIEGQLKEEQLDWLAANQTWDNGALLPVITRQGTGENTTPRWIWEDGKTGRKNLKRFELVQHIVDMTDASLHMGWVFRPLPEWKAFELRRRDAALTVFEASVLKPVLDAAREKILWETAPGTKRTPELESSLADAYEQLALLEAWVVNGKNASGADPLSPPNAARWKVFYEKLLAYILSPEDYKSADPAGLARLTDFAYTHQGREHDHSWMAENAPDKHTSALASAASLLFGQAARDADLSDQQRQDSRKAKAASLKRFTDAEDRLGEWNRSTIPHQRLQVESEGMEVMRGAAREYAQLAAKENGMTTSTLNGTQLESVAHTTVAVIDATKHPQLKPYGDNASRLFGKTVASPVDTGDDAWAAARRRLESYEKSFAAVTPEQVQLSAENMLGHLVNRLTNAAQVAAKVSQAGTDAPKPGADADKETEIRNYLAQFRGSGLVSRVFTDYLAALRSTLKVRLKFPLTMDGGSYDNTSDLNTNCEALTPVETDMSDLATAINPLFAGTERKELDQLFANLRPVFSIKKTLQGSGVPGRAGGLRIEFGAVQPPIPRMTVIPGGTTGGFFNKTTTPPITKTDLEGVTHIAILIAGIAKIDQAPSGVAPPPAEWDGFASVEVRVSTVTPANPTETTQKFSSGPGWELLKQCANGRAISVGAKASFRVVADPPLPPLSHWPKRSDLGLSSF